MEQISREEAVGKTKSRIRQTDHHLDDNILTGLVAFRPRESKTVVECYDGDYTNRMMSDDEEDEREDVANV